MYFFLETIKECGFEPKLVQTDCETENGITVVIQSKLQNDVSAHRYGSSPSNQRIENWWSHNKRQFMSWVIDIFKGLVFNGTLETGNATHMECVWLVFIKFLQYQLDEVRFEGNTHYILRSRHDTVPGLLDVLFFLPDISGHINKIKIDVSESVLDEHLAKEILRKKLMKFRRKRMQN